MGRIQGDHMSTEIFIIGLNEIGASINLAFVEGNADLSITGYDQDSKRAREARKRGDISKVVFTPKKTAQTADLIFLAVPPIDVLSYLELLAPVMKKDAVLVDMCSLKTASFQWAQEHFRDDRYYLGAVPVLNPDLLNVSMNERILPRPDIFKGGLFALTIPPQTPEKIVNTVLGIINFLEAEPFFMDPLELDAAMATVEGLPCLAGLALMRVALNAPSWREIQRLTGRSWATAANVGAHEPARELAASLILNKENVGHRVNALVEELEVMQALIHGEDEEALAIHLEEAANAYGSWITRRKEGGWEVADSKPLAIPKTSLLERLFGPGDFRRKGKD
jgi:prephenate dehydrogenase